jgi:large subunit ribosomal protein L14e
MTDVKDSETTNAAAKTDAAPVTKRQKKIKGKARPKYFEIGRVCQITFGPYAGKICVILDFVDSTKCLIDGPECRTGVPRQTIPFNRLALTKMKIHVLRACRTGLVRKEFDRQEVARKYARSNWAKKAARAKLRRSLTDLQRFHVMCLSMKKSRLIRNKLAELSEWRTLARKYKQGTIDKPDELLAAQRCLFGMPTYRHLKYSKWDDGFDPKKPLGKWEFNDLKFKSGLGKGFKRWVRRNKRSKKMSKEKVKKMDAARKAMRIKRLQTTKKTSHAEKLAKLPKKHIRSRQDREMMRKKFLRGKTKEEIVVLNRKYKQKKKWLKTMALKRKAKKKTANINQHNALMRKNRKAKAEKDKSKREEELEKNPELKKKVLARRESRKAHKKEKKAKRKIQREADLKKQDAEKKAKKAAKKAAAAKVDPKKAAAAKEEGKKAAAALEAKKAAARVEAKKAAKTYKAAIKAAKAARIAARKKK